MFLSEKATYLMRVFSVMALIDGWAFLFNPGLVQSGAYSWAGSILPQPAWGGLFLASAASLMFSLGLDQFRPSWARVSHLGAAARVGMLLYGLCCMVFGSSILILTLDGTTSAITGTTKWWLPFILTVRFLSWQSIYTEELNYLNIEEEEDS